MNVVYRDAQPADAAALRALFAESFVETFGHLYRAEDLQDFLDGNSEAKWEGNLSDPEVAIQVAERHGDLLGFVSLDRASLNKEFVPPYRILNEDFLFEFVTLGLYAEHSCDEIGQIRGRISEDLRCGTPFDALATIC